MLQKAGHEDDLTQDNSEDIFSHLFQCSRGIDNSDNLKNEKKRSNES